MYSDTHLNNKNRFEEFIKNTISKSMEDMGFTGDFSLKNAYNLCKVKPWNPEDSQVVVNELKQTSEGVWECDILLPVADENQESNLKPIYKNSNKYNICGFGSIDSDRDISNADTGLEDEEDYTVPKKVHSNFPGGKFIPVMGYNGCNFPPDYRLIKARGGPQFTYMFPANAYRPTPPAYINNQFLRPSRLARWNSLEKDDVENWDPFNLKNKNTNYGVTPVPTQFNRHVDPRWVPNRFGSLRREVLVYPNAPFHPNARNSFNGYN